jgi:uncharacterized damage-inducible protein DinB
MSVLASHIANVPGYGVMIATRSEFDTAAGGSPSRGEYTSREELLTAFDQNVKAGRDAMSSMRDEDFRANWTFRRGDQVILNGPRALALRTLVMSHLIHHRGQLSVYLRLNDVPLPSVYGPTADT